MIIKSIIGFAILMAGMYMFIIKLLGRCCPHCGMDKSFPYCSHPWHEHQKEE